MRTPTGLALALTLSTAAPVAADWLVYLGGGLQETRGPWQVRGGQVRFHAPSGTWLTVRADEVDLAASAFLSWQVGEARHKKIQHPPAGAEMRVAGEAGKPAGESPCVPARLVRVAAAETLDIEIDGRRETIHLACIDAPEPRHRFPELAWFGHQSAAVVQTLARPGQTVCVGEERPPLRDRQEHRIAYVRLPDGRDLGGEVIARGLGLVRSGGCARERRYVDLERSALIEERGHWGPSGNQAALAIASQSLAFHAAPAPRRGGGGGGGG